MYSSFILVFIDLIMVSFIVKFHILFILYTRAIHQNTHFVTEKYRYCEPTQEFFVMIVILPFTTNDDVLFLTDSSLFITLP